MNQTSANESKESSDQNFKIAVAASLVVLAVAVAWLGWRVENPPAHSAKKTETTKQAGPETANNGWNTTVTSGQGGFSVTLPDGWGPIVKDTGSDFFIMGGTEQPNPRTGKEVKITELSGYGTDSPSVFSMVMGENFAAVVPQGEASEFVIGKADDAVTGTKYVYEYPGDDYSGIGTQRFTGDRDYEYVFPYKGKELRVYYSVYGSDPRNLSVTVDEIVRRVRFN